MNWIATIVAALVPTVLGFIWYHEKVMGKMWMKETGLTKEDVEKDFNMPLVMGLSLLFSIMFSMYLNSIVIHQMHVGSVLMDAIADPSRKEAAEAIAAKFNAGGEYANEFRRFGHGALHGLIAGIFFVLPIMATNGMYEKKSFKLAFINSAYWTLTLILMGGIICAWK
ncbi:MAG: DUF1761 domain-containing protein [Saprospiraceae bacterium]|nr:DUF1761 domain-containing protein [Saprospiraceae bacterium]MBK7811696.1 DUF1761 domain-containing protein [Saprospiraceae bacterium]MBK9631583.1 DUF1761 domain-containing protein [Saprospiraceae bacterium]